MCQNQTKSQNARKKTATASRGYYYFLPSVSVIAIPERFKKVTLRNAKKLEWPSVVLLDKAVMR